MTDELNGLVLAGGLSSRMGEEKGLIKYHGFPQYLYAMQLLRNFCNRVYLACREEQKELFSEVNIIADKAEYAGHGPISGLLSAHEQKNSAWLVLACDHPYVQQPDLDYLFDMRDKTKIATVFKNEASGLIEPLTGIYEEAAFLPLKQWYAEKNYSLRKFLETRDVQAITPANSAALISVDNAEDKKTALSYFRN